MIGISTLKIVRIFQRSSLLIAVVLLLLFQFAHGSASPEAADQQNCASMMATGHEAHGCDESDMADGAACSIMSCSFGVAIFEQSQIAASYNVTFAGYRYSDIEQVRSVNLSAFRKPPKQS